MAASLVQFRVLRSNVNSVKCWKFKQVLTFEKKRFSTQYLRPYSMRKKLPYVAFMIGFGLAGFVGYSGLFTGKRKQKYFDAAHLSETQTSHQSSWTIQSAIDESRLLIKCMKEHAGSPGVSVAVSMDGKLVWSEGFGFADVENRVLCSARTVMRIASISKPLVATAVAKLWEQEELDLDAPIQSYVPSFPEKTFNGSTVTLTTRHLLSHLAGVRHYDKSLCQKGAQEPREEKSEDDSKQETKLRNVTSTLKQKAEKKTGVADYRMEPDSEYYIKDHYKTVTEALTLFKDDPLISAPGTSYLYTTHGWTILSSVVESVAKQEFLLHMKNLFKDLGMENTCAEFNDKIIPHRARFYQRDKKGHLVNAPYVDNSYKWAGGGFMSTAEDLVQFGNAMLYAKQANSCLASRENSHVPAPDARPLPGILRPETVAELWKIVMNTEGGGHERGGYGMGWTVVPEKQKFGACPYQRETVLHAGGAVGASSILLIRPQLFNPATHAQISSHDSPIPPQGIVVAILVNLQNVSLEKTAATVATLFENMRNRRLQIVE